jgi:hypothetical protein
MALGESDAERRAEEIDRFINGHAGEHAAI